MAKERTPAELREGVRSGILAALDRDAELRGGQTARLLIAAGALGVFGAIGMIRMLSGHPYGHHPAWHVVVFAALWSGVLVVALALILLRVRTPSLPLARAACIGILGLGFAGICSGFCPDQHFLDWWSSTRAGGALGAIGGLPISALCFGAVTTIVFGAAAAVVAPEGRPRSPLRPPLPAAMLLILLAPGVALQSFGTSWIVFTSWMLGTAIGAYFGVSIGFAVRARMATG